MKSPFFISCPIFLEDLLEKEVQHFCQNYKVERGGISLQTDLLTAVEIMLNSRIASRVFQQLTEFDCANEDEYKNEIRKFDFLKVMKLDQTFKFQTLLDKEAKKIITNSNYINLISKDAVVDQFREKKKGARPSIDKDADVSFTLRGTREDNKFHFTLSLDLCGEALSNRGYRVSGHSAPLRENVAAALVQRTGWMGDTSLYDPFCGTGTFLIEALMIKYKIPPTFLKLKQQFLHREKIFALENHIQFARNTELKKKFYKLCNETYKKALKRPMVSVPLYGSDLEARFKPLILKTIKKLGLEERAVVLTQKNALESSPPNNQRGIVLCNPPYGERLGTLEETQELYHQFGERLKSDYKNWDAFILTSNPELRKSIGLKTNQRIEVKNGDLDCRLLHYQLY